MKRAQFLPVLFVITSFVLHAQNRTFLSFDGGFKGDLYKLSDANGLLRPRQPLTGYLGFGISQELTSHWMLESGARLMNYQFGVSFKDVPTMSYGNALHTWHIPLLVKYRLHDHKNRFSVTPYAGFVLGINGDHTNRFPPDFGMSNGSGSFTSGGNTYSWDETGYTNLKKTFGLFETGLTLDYRTKRGFQFFLGGSWQGGFSKIMQFDVNYKINDGPEHQATYTSKGNNFRIMFGVSYAVSRFWQEKRDEAEKEAVRERVTRLSTSRFYVGTEIYGIWNRFTHDNPDIFTDGAWEDFGLGIYGGVRVWKPLWVETGFYTERFSNHYVVYENDQFISGGGFMTGGTGFYRIPLLLRYRFTTAHGRLSFSPYVGASLLISATGTGEYDRSNSYGWSDDGIHAIDTVYDNSVAYRLKKSVVTLNAGMGVEYALFPRLLITLHGDYSLGFTDINRLHVKLDGSLSGTREGNILFNGSGWRISAGIKIPLGKR
jgi:hypothetical protein